MKSENENHSMSATLVKFHVFIYVRTACICSTNAFLIDSLLFISYDSIFAGNFLNKRRIFIELAWGKKRKKEKPHSNYNEL